MESVLFEVVSKIAGMFLLGWALYAIQAIIDLKRL